MSEILAISVHSGWHERRMENVLSPKTVLNNGKNLEQKVIKYFDLRRMLATVQNSAVNTGNSRTSQFMFSKYLMESQNLKIVKSKFKIFKRKLRKRH